MSTGSQAPSYSRKTKAPRVPTTSSPSRSALDSRMPTQVSSKPSFVNDPFIPGTDPAPPVSSPPTASPVSSKSLGKAGKSGKAGNGDNNQADEKIIGRTDGKAGGKAGGKVGGKAGGKARGKAGEGKNTDTATAQDNIGWDTTESGTTQGKAAQGKNKTKKRRTRHRGIRRAA